MKKAVFHLVGISQSIRIKAGEEIILQYVEFPSSNLATNSTNSTSNNTCLRGIDNSVLMIISRKFNGA
jgi:hypothetical protein